MTTSRPGTKKISQISVVGGAMRTGKRGGLALLATLAGIAAVAAPGCAQDLSRIFRAVNPSVVVVRTSEREVSAEGQLAKVGEVGSGVLISSDGKVMTAAHVVHLADRIVVGFLGGEGVGARIIASEADADVPLLQLDRVPAGALVATLGDSDRAQIGEPVFIIGAPYGIGHTLSAGHITGRHEPDTVYHDLAKAEFLQTDAAINQGNSGGPMFDMQGHALVGGAADVVCVQKPSRAKPVPIPNGWPDGSAGNSCVGSTRLASSSTVGSRQPLRPGERRPPIWASPPTVRR